MNVLNVQGSVGNPPVSHAVHLSIRTQPAVSLSQLLMTGKHNRIRTACLKSSHRLLRMPLASQENRPIASPRLLLLTVIRILWTLSVHSTWVYKRRNLSNLPLLECCLLGIIASKILANITMATPQPILASCRDGLVIASMHPSFRGTIEFQFYCFSAILKGRVMNVL